MPATTLWVGGLSQLLAPQRVLPISHVSFWPNFLRKETPFVDDHLLFGRVTSCMSKHRDLMARGHVPVTDRETHECDSRTTWSSIELFQILRRGNCALALTVEEECHPPITICICGRMKQSGSLIEADHQSGSGAPSMTARRRLAMLPRAGRLPKRARLTVRGPSPDFSLGACS